MVSARPLSAIAALALAQVSAATRDIPELEARLAHIDEQLTHLPSFSMQTGVGAIGFRSRTYPDAKNTEWIRIDLGSEHQVDLVVIVPAIWREAGESMVADGFPTEFEIRAGGGGDPEGGVIARFTAADMLLPRIAPFDVACAGKRVEWIELRATMLGTRAWDGAHVLQLSEIMVFSGEENIALRRPLTTSSEGPVFNNGARGKAFLVDGSLPYLMNAGQGKKSQAYLAGVSRGETIALTVDLGKPAPVNRIHFHTIETADTIPQANRSNYGTPRRLHVEGSESGYFSDARTLFTYEQRSIYDVAPIIPFRFPETVCRRLRVVIDEPDRLGPSEPGPTHEFFGFAEIEAFSRGRNILQGLTFEMGFTPAIAERPISDLTDGRNIFGTILPARAWMEQLALRHDLEASRPAIVARLNHLYSLQNEHLILLRNLAILLGGGLIIVALISRMLRMRMISKLRRRFAADLHDEIGANLHAIGLLSDIVGEQATAVPGSESLRDTVLDIRAVTGRTADAVRYLADSQNPRKPLGTLEEDMHRIAARMMDDMAYEIRVSGGDFIAKLPHRTRADLFLFYKECLVNISRHSDARRFIVAVSADEKTLRMSVEDDGSGMAPGILPPSLQRRARILRGKLEVQSPPPGAPRGTRIVLTLRRHVLFRFIPFLT
jgi:signal transduction histidine kinase